MREGSGSLPIDDKAHRLLTRHSTLHNRGPRYAILESCVLRHKVI